MHKVPLFNNLGDSAGANRAPAFPDGNRSPLSMATGVINSTARFALSPASPSRSLPATPPPRHVRRPEVELRPVPLKNGVCRPPSSLLSTYTSPELAVRRDRVRLGHHLPALHFVLLHAPQQQPYVVPRAPSSNSFLNISTPSPPSCACPGSHNLRFLATFTIRSQSGRHHRPAPWIERCPRSASETACRWPAAASVCSCPPRHQVHNPFSHSGSPFNAPTRSPAPPVCRPRKLVTRQQLRTSSSTSSSSSSSSIMSTLFRHTTM